ncbi:MAG: HAD-IA family hydrolase [Phycisphaerae bacterium]
MSDRSSSPRCDAIIFDLDGTLADTLADIAAALNDALTALGRDVVHTVQVRTWVGEGLPTLCHRAWPQAGPADAERLIAAARTAYDDHFLVQTRLYPGVEELLDALGRAGVPAAVLSNKPHDLTVRTLEGLRIADRFAVVRGYRNERDKKPAAEPALEIARAMGIEPAAVAFVGDGVVDIATARAAAMVPIAVTWGFRSRDELRAAGAEWFVDRPADVLRFVRPADAK